MKTIDGFIKECKEENINISQEELSKIIFALINTLKHPTEKMSDTARGFIMGLQLRINTYEDMHIHLKRYGDNPPDWMPTMGKLTKWDIADCIFKLMAEQGLKELSNG